MTLDKLDKKQVVCSNCGEGLLQLYRMIKDGKKTRPAKYVCSACVKKGVSRLDN